MDSKPNSRKAVFLLLVVFVLGIALGAVGAYLAGGRARGAKLEGHGSQDRRARMLAQLTEALALTPDQQKQVDAILAEMQAKYVAIHEQISPQTAQLRQQSRERIRSLLTPEQQPKLDEFFRRWDEEHKKKNGR